MEPQFRETYGDKGKEKSLERRYDTMTLGQIKAIPVAALAADDCALLLWAVWPNLPAALEVIEARGFQYKTCGFCWVKPTPSGGLRTGCGFHTRSNSEPCEVIKHARNLGFKLTGAELETDIYECWADRVLAALAFEQGYMERCQVMIDEANRYAV
jgi:N6-adenosine-specific RNA methylase IME4